jgi:hypothetical protein
LSPKSDQHQYKDLGKIFMEVIKDEARKKELPEILIDATEGSYGFFLGQGFKVSQLFYQDKTKTVSTVADDAIQKGIETCPGEAARIMQTLLMECNVN